MSKIAAEQRAGEYRRFKKAHIPESGREEDRRLIAFLDDYMRIRYGMQPLDKPIGPNFIPDGRAAEWFERSNEALDRAASVEMELVDPRAIDARDKLQRIMSGLPVSTPHFHELDELLRKLDAMAGQPVTGQEPKVDPYEADESIGYQPPMEWLERLRSEFLSGTLHPLRACVYHLFKNVDDGRWALTERPVTGDETISQTAAGREAAGIISNAEIDEAARNMAPGPDYRPPGAVMNILCTEINRADWSRLKDVAEELADHVAAGRWEIVSHVPEQLDFAAAFNVEAKRALAKLSVQNPLRNILLKAMSEIELKP